MVSIFATTEFHDQIQAIIQQEDRLEELVSIIDILEQRPTPNAHSIILKNGELGFTLDWQNQQPPFLLPEEIILNAPNLLGIVFAKLGNYEKAHEYLQKTNAGLFSELDFINRLQHGIPLKPEELISNYAPYEDYRLMHNNAIVRHYASEPGHFDIEKTAYFYEEALKSAPTEEHRAFTARQYALLLIDLQHTTPAKEVLERVAQDQLSEEAKTELLHTLCQLQLQQLSVPYDQHLLESLKSNLWNVLQAYEAQGRLIEAGLLLLDATQIANIDQSFSEALGYVTRAIRIFEEEGLADLAGNAQLRKGTLLYTWAQHDNPQFFRPAVEAYQEALKIFTKEAAPNVFADIHHHLGVIYTDMPTESKKKSIWAGVANSSFLEALDYYTKSEFPYEYGMICNSYANAFTKFPQAVLTDNFEKALFYYQEALDVRTPAFPFERAITLLNYLEASWRVGNSEEEFNEVRYQDMLAKAQEVKTLVEQPEILQAADEHLQLLSELKAVVSK